MTQKNNKTLNEFPSKPAEKNNAINKTDVYHIDDILSLYISELKDYSVKNNRRLRYDLVIIDSFSKFGWTVPLKKKKAQTERDVFEKILIGSKRRPNLFETDRGKEFYNNIFQEILNKSNINIYSRKSSYGAVFRTL